jgi:uncharacterized protein (DUF2141 family)
MRCSHYFLLFFSFLYVIFTGCASQSNIQGGPKDITPPELIATKSTPNYTTQFNQREIVLQFDEFVKIQDAANNMVITPPLVYNPKLETKGKKVVFQFNEKEVLRPNTTYIIQFGKAIQDITESNPAEYLKYVFSTGLELDSLVLKGRILNFDDMKPLEGVSAILFDSALDSAIYKDRPVYFAKTDKSGEFEMSHLAPGTYQIVALKDENNNYKLDSPKELVGFYEQRMISISEDTTVVEDILVFMQIGKPLIQDVDSTKRGEVKIRYDKDISQSEIIISPDIQHKYLVEGSSLTLWHTADSLTRWYIYLNHVGGTQDSLWISSYPLNAEMRQAILSASAIGEFRKNEHPDSLIIIRFSNPIQYWDQIKWRLYTKTDTIGKEPKIITSGGSWTQYLTLAALESGEYRLKIDSGGVVDYFGAINSKQIEIPIVVPERSQYVEFKLKIDSLDINEQYLFRLMDKNKVLDSWITTGESEVQRSYPAMRVGAYELEVIVDSNKNGMVDGGNFLQRRYPERKTIFKLEPLRPEWDSDQTVKLKE